MKHGQMSVFAGFVDQPRKHGVRCLRDAVLAGIGRAQLERLEPDTVGALFGQAHDQSVPFQNLQQLIDGGSGDTKLAGERGGLGLAVAGDEFENIERAVGRRGQRDARRG